MNRKDLLSLAGSQWKRIMSESLDSLLGHSPADLKNLDRETLLYKVAPHFFLEIMHKYFRLKVEGLENIPKRGKAIITPNHSGVSGFDAMLIAHEVHQGRQRLPKILTHHLWFLNETTAIPAQKLGFIEATMKNGMRELRKNHLIILFPEGEYGNFKPSSKAYQLQEFKRGFVRMALKMQAPIIPTVVLGAEEANINLSQIKLTKYLRGLVLPLPLNIIPLPSKWKIRFFEPIHLPYQPSAAKDSELVHEIANDIQERLQKAINGELRRRTSVFFD